MNLRGLLRRRSPATPCPACGSTDVLWEDEGVYGAGELLWWCAACLHQWHPGDLGAGAGGGSVATPGPAAPMGTIIPAGPQAPATAGPASPANGAVSVPPPTPAAPAPPTPPAASLPPAVPPPPLQPPPNAPGPATVAERVMHAAGLTPLGPCPGAYEPWPCHCARCGRTTSPTYRQVRDEGVGCACSTGRRRRPRFLTKP
ncbi:hypothetical protein [Streptomyces sp. NPDC045470]|uniref:hypothetical protein n=1 Tax=unclassified Streptomyces TaxID=2593676 RepID=UPI0033D1C533